MLNIKQFYTLKDLNQLNTSFKTNQNWLPCLNPRYYQNLMPDLKLERPSSLEIVMGNTGTDIAATLLAAFSGNPVAALLPVLTNALASGRHKERVEKTISEIESVLEEHSEQLIYINDQQYKLINETILAVFQAVDQSKIEYLKRVIRNTLNDGEIQSQERITISRYP